MSLDINQAAAEVTSHKASQCAKRRKPRHRWRDRMLHLITFAAFIGLWYLMTWKIGALWVSSPMLVVHKIWAGLQDGSVLQNTWLTTEEAFLGLALGTILGIISGLLIARSKLASKLLNPYILGAYSLPRIALAPFFIIWFGIGLESKVTLVMSVVIFVVLLNVRQGVETVDNDLVDALRTMRASQWQITRHVVIPTVLPWIASAIKISVGLALVSAIVSEMMGSTAGLGYSIEYFINNFDMTGAVMTLLVMAVLAMVLFYMLTWAERRLFAWRGDSERTQTEAI